eukprot:jgi/Bigna1/38946/e_gw1.29.120.1
MGPLLRAERFALVGDHYQLPPLARSEEARRKGYDVSLFKRLSAAHPVAVARLSQQYRMNRDIQLLSNALVYNFQLRCASQEVADACLSIPRLDRALETSVGRWGGSARRVFAPSARVVFADTDKIGRSCERREKKGYTNEVEARVVAKVVHAMVTGGVSQSQIGIISPYRLQLETLREMLRDEASSLTSSDAKATTTTTGVMVETVDKFQGLDKDCILISLVRSNLTAEVGRLLRDWRRINVAVTRAKKKLILVGSFRTLRNAHLLGSCLELIKARRWVVSLPKNALR